ncbi:MAG: LysM peptidoglycan-binding domain-containing protein [Chloroflexi bacterium]|nr:LysM peptidoglycan-binding domain-containing protein [Chloroflexota bacterium]
MASPWISPQRQPASRAERPWLGMALLAGIPLLALILLRMLWSGSSLWFLTVGLILLGAAAVIFLARRPQELEYGRTLEQETSRVPLALAGLGVLFLAMLLLPNYADGGSPRSSTNILQEQQDVLSGVAGNTQAPAATAVQPPASSQEEAPSTELDIPAGSEVYTVADGDTLWDIAISYGTTVEAIVAANHLANEADIAIGEELIIPPPGSLTDEPLDDSGATGDGVAQ